MDRFVTSIHRWNKILNSTNISWLISKPNQTVTCYLQ